MDIQTVVATLRASNRGNFGQKLDGIQGAFGYTDADIVSGTVVEQESGLDSYNNLTNPNLLLATFTYDDNNRLGVALI